MDLPKNLAARYSVMSSEDTAQGMMGSKGAAALIENLPAAALRGSKPGYLTADEVSKEERTRPGAIGWNKYGPSFHMSGKEVNAGAKRMNTEDLYAALGKKHGADVGRPTGQGQESAAVKAEVKAELVKLETPAPSAAAEKVAEKAAQGTAVQKAEAALSGFIGDFTMPELSLQNIVIGLAVLGAGVAAGVVASRKGLI